MSQCCETAPRCPPPPICSCYARSGRARSRGSKAMGEVTDGVGSQQDETLTLQALERRCRSTGADFFALLISGLRALEPA